MKMSVEVWHERFIQQAAWTSSVRTHLLKKAEFDRQPVLEVGCGTGAVLSTDEIAAAGNRHGLDIDLERLQLAKQLSPGNMYCCGDGHHLPYPSGNFSASICHFLLLWVADPVAVLTEMARVTRPGGVVLALAEPDYGGRVAYPPALQEIGPHQIKALHEQGADPFAGREVHGWFKAVGLNNVFTGVLGGEWRDPLSEEEWAMEWNVIEDDLQGSIPAGRLAALKAADNEANKKGKRILYVPTFYAIGWK